MTFDLSQAPMDAASTTKRALAAATGTADYQNGVGDPVNPADLRMGKLFLINGLMAVVLGKMYIGFLAAVGDGTYVVFWYDAATGNEAADHTNISTWGQFGIEAIGQ